MKKRNIVIGYAILAFLLIVSRLFADMQTMTIPVCSTNLLANSTNATPAGAVPVPQMGLGASRIYFTGYGSAATTNGTITIYLQTAIAKAGPYDSQSTNLLFKATFNANGATNQWSDWYQLSGIPWIRCSQMENTSLGPYTNGTITVVFPNPNDRR